MDHQMMPSRLYYCAEREVTAADIPRFAEEVMCSLHEDLQTAGIEITGPPEFHYFNVDPAGEKPFRLVIAIPTAKRQPGGRFFFLESEPFACLITEYRGAMPGIGAAWMKLVEAALAEGYLLQNQVREVYREWVGFDAEENRTELQLGIAGRKLG